MNKLLSIIMLLSAALAVHAKSSVELFSIDKVVESNTDQERSQLLPQALTDVLVKVTGDKRVTDNVDLQAVIQEKAAIALQKYHYLNQGTVKKVHLVFSEDEVKRFLAKYHLTFWPGERPEVVVWLTYTSPEANQWEFVTEDSKASYLQSLKQQAQWRGLPVNFPVLDLQDLRSLTDAQDITEQGPALKNISKRYHADYVLAGSISTDKTGEWRSHWKLMNDSEVLHWEFSGKNMVEVFTQGVDAVADSIVERTATIAEDKHSPKQLFLSVNQIRSVEDYLQAMHYLQKAKGVERVEVLAVNNDSVNFEVFLNSQSSKDRFKKMIEQDAILTIAEQSPVAKANTLYCQLGLAHAQQAVA